MRTSNLFILSLVIVCALTPFSLSLNGESVEEASRGNGPLKGGIIVEEQYKCVNLYCNVTCLNGHISNIVADIENVVNRIYIDCPELEELRIYNYEFPNETVSRDFLGEYKAKVLILSIFESNITNIEAGAFANGSFRDLSIEGLHLSSLRRDFFEGVSPGLKSLSIVQKNTLLSFVENDFLQYVGHQIWKLKLQIDDISWLGNLTPTDSFFNKLQTADFSHNNLSTALTATTFNKFSVLKRLDLSHSLITYLPEYIFVNLSRTLRRVDLSHNKLHTISHKSFGWRYIQNDLKIVLNHNEWSCSCELLQEVEKIYSNSRREKLYCSRPEIYRNWSVWDKGLCINTTDHVISFGTTQSSTVPQIENFSVVTEENQKASGNMVTSPKTVDGNVVPIECSRIPLMKNLSPGFVRWPSLQFELRAQPVQKVDVHIQSGNLSDSYRLVWFSKVTKQYYKMEVNYNEYGLGCYSSAARSTSVSNLLSAVNYTFCLMVKGQPTVSPFSCKSTHVGAKSIHIAKNAWLSEDMRLFGILMAVFGIVMFLFIGIMVVFLVLRRKPILLKGSKRVATTKAKNGEIVIFPTEHSIENFRRKEQMLTQGNSKSTASCRRRSSMDSFESNESYINANIYEVIPSYLYFNADVKKIDNNPPSTQPAPDLISFCTQDSEYYTEIPLPGKRLSDDPLPELPTHRTDYSEPLISICFSEHPASSEGLKT